MSDRKKEINQRTQNINNTTYRTLRTICLNKYCFIFFVLFLLLSPLYEWRWITDLFLCSCPRNNTEHFLNAAPCVNAWSHIWLLIAHHRHFNSINIQNSIFNEHFYMKLPGCVCIGFTKMRYVLYTMFPIGGANERKTTNQFRCRDYAWKHFECCQPGFGYDYRLLFNLFVLFSTRNLQSKHRQQLQPIFLFQITLLE